MTKSYILRVCRADMTSRDGFQWPGVGEEVTAPDWVANHECGNGLHGWLHGVGYHGCVGYWNEDGAKWLVVEADTADIINLGDKVKFRKGIVRFVGNKSEAAAYIDSVDDVARASAVIGAVRSVGDKQSVMVGALGTATAGYEGNATAGHKGTATAGDYGTATVGNYGTATVGHEGTATAGDFGTATAGDYGTATAGYNGTATAGEHGTATAGNYGNATAGYKGTATAGNQGTATVGDFGTATAGNYGTAKVGICGTATAGEHGTATAGDCGTATADYRGKASAGIDGIINIYYFDKGNKRRLATAYVGENNIKPNTFYTVDNTGIFKKGKKRND